MREREAMRAAYRAVRETCAGDYPSGFWLDICMEHDGAKRKAWSFGVHDFRDDEDAEDRDEATPERTGYVHANGYVEGLY